MDPITVMALMAAGQGVMGLFQKGQSAAMRRRAKKEFSPYEIPQSATLALDKAQSLASQRGVPGEDIYRSRASASAARGVESAARFAESPTDVLGILSQMYGSTMANFEQNMALSGMQAYERRQQNLMNALNRYAQFETEQWQYNELYPYMQALGEAGQVDAAGNANIGSAINTGMNIMGSKWDIENQQKQFEAYKQMRIGEIQAMNPNAGMGGLPQSTGLNFDPMNPNYEFQGGVNPFSLEDSFNKRFMFDPNASNANPYLNWSNGNTYSRWWNKNMKPIPAPEEQYPDWNSNW